MSYRAEDLKYLIDEHGLELTLSVITTGSYNVSTGTVTNTSTNYTVKGYFYDYKLLEIDGTNVVYGDRRIVFPLVDVNGDAIPEPSAGDTVSGYGDKVSIVSVKKIMSVGPMCYICQVRE